MAVSIKRHSYIITSDSLNDFIHENTTRKDRERYEKLFTDDGFANFMSIDDYESYQYFVIDGKVIVTHDCDVVGIFCDFDEFMRLSAEEFNNY